MSKAVLTPITSRVKVLTVPILSDNYSYLIIDTINEVAAAVDPAEPDTVLRAAKEQGVDITTILTTHHHWDHAGGNEDMVTKLGGDVAILGWTSKKGNVGRMVKEGEKWELGVGGKNNSGKLIGGRVYSTPCHTKGHVCYVLEDEGKDVAVFTGDTLFVGGCGKFFEGNGDDMWMSLSKLRGLDDGVKVFCGHEYTQKNLAFAKSVEPENDDLKEMVKSVDAVRNEGGFTVPSTIGAEKKWNPFMRVEHASIAKAVGLEKGAEPAKVMGALRTKKDNF